MSASAKTGQHLKLNQLASVDASGEPGYAIYRLSNLETLDTLSLHVLARAYRTAWRALYGGEPRGQHVITPLDLVIEFRGVERSDYAAGQIER